MFASCVGYYDRAYYGFYVTSSKMYAVPYFHIFVDRHNKIQEVIQ